MTTIKTSREIDRVFRDGTRVSNPLIMAIGTTSPAEATAGGRVAFIAGRKVGGAVQRNRAKRLMREACRRLGGPWRGWDILLVARAATVTATQADTQGAVETCLRRLGVIA